MVRRTRPGISRFRVRAARAPERRLEIEASPSRVPPHIFSSPGQRPAVVSPALSRDGEHGASPESTLANGMI